MSSGVTFWEQVVADDFAVPKGRPLDDLTAELTRMLGDPDPHLRDELAYPLLATWIGDGVYDDLLTGLGDGMCAGLEAGIGEHDTDSVFRRSFSALVVATCIERDTTAQLVPVEVILRWGDRLAGWLVREHDIRGFIPGKGWAHTLAHGADAVGELGRNHRLGKVELTVLLDVLADRILLPARSFWNHAEADRFALATMHILRRDLIGMDVLEPWIARIAASAVPRGDVDTDPYLASSNAEAFLRALHLQLALAPRPPAIRPDLLLNVIDQLRTTNAMFLLAPRHAADA